MSDPILRIAPPLAPATKPGSFFCKGSTMQFIGLDLAWGEIRTSAAVVLQLQEHELVTTAHNDHLRDDAEILTWINQHDLQGGLMLGIDAPLKVPNVTGQRDCERDMRMLFGSYEGGCHPSNRTLFHHNVRGERMVLALEKHGIDSDPIIIAKDFNARRCIEVFPHPAQVALFGLNKTLKYKAKKNRSREFRMQEFDRLIQGFKNLAETTPKLQTPSWAVTPYTLKGNELKQKEDLLDALMCAYVAAYYWYHGHCELCGLIGDKQRGHIVTPLLPGMLDKLSLALAKYS